MTSAMYFHMIQQQKCLDRLVSKCGKIVIIGKPRCRVYWFLLFLQLFSNEIVQNNRLVYKIFER